ncbi:MAG: glycerophosphodiester phosphodiesterase family protein [Candidatus Roizmanbacteria bacterium]
MSPHPHPKIIAHRGASSLAPENTLASFRKAHALGIRAIELDVHLSADGALVVHHDYALGKPDNGTGLISEMTLATIKQADAGGWYAPEFRGERIPTLDEVFQEFGTEIEYEIELKGTSTAFVEKVCALVDAHGLMSHIEFTSPHIALLCHIAHRRPDARCGIFFDAYPSWMSPVTGDRILIDMLTLASAKVAHIPKGILTRILVDRLHANDFIVHAANCDTEDEVRHALSLGIDQFSTNDVLLAMKIGGEV